MSDYAGNGNWGTSDGPALEAELSDLKNIVIDSNDNIFFSGSDRIRKVSANGDTVSTIAGEWGGYSDGYGSNARFSAPQGLAIDAQDNLYVADANNSIIRKISDINGQVRVTTISGTGEYDYVDGTSELASYRRPRYVAYGGGSLFVVDTDDNRIRKVQLTPKMTIPAGQLSVTYNIKSINDAVYETNEVIRLTSSSVTGGSYSGGDIDLTLISDELTPKIVLNSDDLVLDEANGTVTLEVSLVDAAGASSNWGRTELPSDASTDYEFMGEFEGHKYYFSKYSNQWPDAYQNALDLGGQLLVIESEQEAKKISSIMIHNGTWLGTKRTQEDSEWTNIYGDLNYENFAGDNFEDNYGYALTYGNQWYNHDQNDYRHYIVEYGPVTSSELPSTVNLVYDVLGTATKGTVSDEVADFKSSAESVTIPAGSQSATVILTGLEDLNEEAIENILVSIADPQNVDLGDQITLDIKISDNEAPVITFVASKDSISENGGSVVLTANLSNPKLNPTTINLGLQGTSTALDDYNVSSIFKYSNFAGSKDNFGSANGIGSQARFDEPIYITSYLNGSMLVSDRVTHTIRHIAADGTVSTIVGKANSCGGDDSGLASDVRICSPGQIAVINDGSGKFIFHTDSRIYMYDPDFNGTGAKMVIELADGMDRIGGVAINSNILYVSQRYLHTVLAIDLSDGSSSTVIGKENNYSQGWRDSDFSVDLTASSLMYPGTLLWDNARNQLYINSAGLDWMQSYWSDEYIAIANFTTNKVTTMPNLMNYYYDSNSNDNYKNASFRAMDLDAEGNLYIPVSNRNAIAKVNFMGDGAAFVSFNITNSDLNSPSSVAYSNGSLFIANYDGPTIDKIGLGASIEIPAMQTTNNITLEAFKDPWFEEDETIDVKVSGLVNGTVASNDVDVVTIVESTRLTLVADAPFEGVENGKVSWGDYDKDGDMDLALMGSASTGTITNVYKNNNGVFENTNQNFTKFIGGDIEFVDVNHNILGNKDLKPETSNNYHQSRGCFL